MTPPPSISDGRPSVVTRPATVLAGPEGHPVHPILVTIPIGAWTASLVFDVASRASDDPAAFGRGAYHLIVIGLVGAAAAALFGYLDYRTIPKGTPARRTGVLHLALNSVALLLFLADAVLRETQVDAPYETPWWALALTVAALAVLGASGYLGGRLAYHYGVRVAGPGKLAEGYGRADAARSGSSPVDSDRRG